MSATQKTFLSLIGKLFKKSTKIFRVDSALQKQKLYSIYRADSQSENFEVYIRRCILFG